MPANGSRVKVWNHVPVVSVVCPSANCIFLVPEREYDQLRGGIDNKTVDRCIWYQSRDERIVRRVTFRDSVDVSSEMGSMTWVVTKIGKPEVMEGRKYPPDSANVVIEGPAIEYEYGAGALIVVPQEDAQLLGNRGEANWPDVKRICETFLVAKAYSGPGASIGFIRQDQRSNEFVAFSPF